MTVINAVVLSIAVLIREVQTCKQFSYYAFISMLFYHVNSIIFHTTPSYDLRIFNAVFYPTSIRQCGWGGQGDSLTGTTCDSGCVNLTD